MKYIIDRASSYEEQPHPKAEMVTLEEYRDVRIFKSKEEWLAQFPNDIDRAKEWGVTAGGKPFRIIGDRDIIFWIIQIDDIVEFVKEVGKIILSPPELGYIGFEDLMRLTICDDDDYVE